MLSKKKSIKTKGVKGVKKPISHSDFGYNDKNGNIKLSQVELERSDDTVTSYYNDKYQFRVSGGLQGVEPNGIQVIDRKTGKCMFDKSNLKSDKEVREVVAKFQKPTTAKTAKTAKTESEKHIQAFYSDKKGNVKTSFVGLPKKEGRAEYYYNDRNEIEIFKGITGYSPSSIKIKSRETGDTLYYKEIKSSKEAKNIVKKYQNLL